MKTSVLVIDDCQQRPQIPEQEQPSSLMREHFIAVVSHELRAPLGSVISFAELLQSDDLDAEDRKKVYEAISRNSEMLLRLVDDILDYSRLENGKLSLNTKKFEFCDFLRKIRADLIRTAESKRLSLDMNLPEKEFFVVGDSIRIRQMLFNLLGNALKFTEQGGVRMSLEMQSLSALTDSPRVQLTFRIQDSGIGIGRENIDRLFQPFGQADVLTRSQKGTGLGLVISRQLARMMGGDLTLISSEPGVGSVFEVSILAQEQSALYSELT